MKRPNADWSSAHPLILGFLTIALLFGGLGTWSVFTTLAGAIVARGQIEVFQNRQTVQHPDGGVVREILVREGSKVAAGDVLLRLDGSELRSDLAIIDNQLLELAARRARLEALRDEAVAVVFPDDLKAVAATRADIAEILAGEASLFDKQLKALAQAQYHRRARMLQIESQMDGMSAQREAIESQIRLLETELATQSKLLAKGLTQASRVSALERELAQLKGRLGEVASGRAEAAGRSTELEIEITAVLTQQRVEAEAELQDLVARELELFERKRPMAKRIAGLEVTAPTSGVVLGLRVTTPQSVIRPADLLMLLVPQDRPLLVVARIPATHIDEVRLGQSVKLVFSSLPSRTTPEIVGKVSVISADSLADEQTGTTYFRTEITLDADSLLELGDVEVVPGMPVDAFIVTANRTPLSYLLKPFADYFRNAFRET